MNSSIKVQKCIFQVEFFIKCTGQCRDLRSDVPSAVKNDVSCGSCDMRQIGQGEEGDEQKEQESDDMTCFYFLLWFHSCFLLKIEIDKWIMCADDQEGYCYNQEKKKCRTIKKPCGFVKG